MLVLFFKIYKSIMIAQWWCLTCTFYTIIKIYKYYLYIEYNYGI